MRPGRFISLLLYGLVCALLGGLEYRRGVVPLVRRLAKLRDHVGRFHCADCREGVEAIDELVIRLGLGLEHGPTPRGTYELLHRGGPTHRSQDERHP